MAAALRLFDRAVYTSLPADRSQGGGLGFVDESPGFAALRRECGDLIKTHSIRPLREGAEGFTAGWLATSSLFVLYDTVPQAKSSRSEFSAQVFVRPGRWGGSMIALGGLLARRVATGRRLGDLLDDEAVDGLGGPEDAVAWSELDDPAAICDAVWGLAEDRPSELELPLRSAAPALSAVLSLMTCTAAAEVSVSLSSGGDPETGWLKLRCVDRSSALVPVPDGARHDLEVCARDPERWRELQPARRRLDDWADWMAAVETVAQGYSLAEFLDGGPAGRSLTRSTTHFATVTGRLNGPWDAMSVSPSASYAKAIAASLTRGDSGEASYVLREAQAQGLGWDVLGALGAGDNPLLASLEELPDEAVLHLAHDMERANRAHVLFDLLPTDVVRLARLAGHDQTHLLAARLCALAAVSSPSALQGALRGMSDRELEEGFWVFSRLHAHVAGSVVTDVVLALCLHRQSGLPLQWAWDRGWIPREDLRPVVDQLVERSPVAREFMRRNLRSYLKAAGITPDVVELIADVVKVKQRVGLMGSRRPKS